MQCSVIPATKDTFFPSEASPHNLINNLFLNKLMLYALDGNAVFCGRQSGCTYWYIKQRKNTKQLKKLKLLAQLFGNSLHSLSAFVCMCAQTKLCTVM